MSSAQIVKALAFLSNNVSVGSHDCFEIVDSPARQHGEWTGALATQKQRGRSPSDAAELLHTRGASSSSAFPAVR